MARQPLLLLQLLLHLLQLLHQRQHLLPLLLLLQLQYHRSKAGFARLLPNDFCWVAI
jgi:hypothetical protein